VNPLTEKVLRSGLIDKATAELMERFGILEEGASEKVDEDVLKNATREKLVAITESLAIEVERENRIKETYLDLERIRWPVTLSLGDREGNFRALSAVIDRQGRYYFRFQDVDTKWFVPGYHIQRDDKTRVETVLEVQTLYIEDKPVAVQVTAQEE
jgi:hypothetical protein